MNKLAIVLLLAVLTVGTSFAQEGGGNPPNEEEMQKRHEKIKAMKIAFITQAVEFTEAEAQAFWPVYNEHEANMEAIRKEHREAKKPFKGKKIDDLTDDEARKMIAIEKDFHAKLHKEMEVYGDKVAAVLPPKKVLKYFKAEQDFKRQILNRMRKGPGGHGGPGGRRGPGGHGGGDMPPPPEEGFDH